MKYSMLGLLVISVLAACNGITESGVTQSNSGVTQASVKVATDLSGKTVEQNNIINRLTEDNKPGAIKHLYLISAYSGDVILYSTVKGKVTSSGKRLTPITVAANDGQYVSSSHQGFLVDVGGLQMRTGEVLQDDGTYGSSVEYIYWWDSKGVYHQQYITGGMILHVSSQPISVKKVIINIENPEK